MNHEDATVHVSWPHLVLLALILSATAAIVAVHLAAKPPAADNDPSAANNKPLAADYKQPAAGKKPSADDKDDKEVRELAEKVLHPRQYSHLDTNGHVVLPPPLLSDDQIGPVAEYLRQRYPYRSLRERLAYKKKLAQDRPLPKLSPTAAKTLAQEDEDNDAIVKIGDDFRSQSLACLHSDKVREFISRAGNGLARKPPPMPEFLNLPEYKPVPFDKVIFSSARFDGKPVPLPAHDPEIKDRSGKDALPSGDAAEAQRYDNWLRRNNPLQMPSFDGLANMHRSSAYDFTNDWRNGYVKDLDHVAGFGAHAMDQLPNADGSLTEHINKIKHRDDRVWLVGRIELMSLLKHNQPGVYISENAPRMDELKAAKTRALNEFETGALKKLRDGDDVVVEAETNRIEMLGAIRASNQCLECHAVKHGELLGAFSYELLRREPIAPPSKRDNPPL